MPGRVFTAGPSDADGILLAIIAGMVRSEIADRAIYKPWTCRRCGRINPANVLVCDCPSPRGGNNP